jgi:type IV pilus assembly protein PilF
MRHQRWAEAERSLARGFELDPGNPALAYNLAEALLRLGQNERARFYAARVNAQPDQVNAQSLWLAARIEQRMGNRNGVQEWGQRLRREFPQSPEALAFGANRFE